MITIAIISKKGEEISEVDITRTEEIEGIAVTKDTLTIKITDQTIKTEGGTGITLIEETIAVETNSEATTGETSQIIIIATMIVPRTKVETLIMKRQLLQDIRKAILKPPSFLRKFATIVATRTILLEIVKREAKVILEVDKFRLTRNQKINRATHANQSRQ